MCCTKPEVPIEQGESADEEEDFDRLSQSSDAREYQEIDQNVDQAEGERNKLACLETSLTEASIEIHKLRRKNKLWSAVSIGSIVWIAYLLYLIRTPQECPPPPIVACPVQQPCSALQPCPVAKACPAPCYKPPGLGEEYDRSGRWPRFDIMDHFIYSVRDGEHGGYGYANVEKGEEILAINGVDVRDKKEDEIREMLATAQSKNSGGRLHLTTRKNWFKFDAVVSAYKRGWKEGSEKVWHGIAVVAASLAAFAVLIAFVYFTERKTRGDNKIKAADKPPPVVETVQANEVSHDEKEEARGSGADSVEQPPVDEQTQTQSDDVPKNETKDTEISEDSVKDPKHEVADNEKTNDNEQASDAATAENASDSSESLLKENNQTSFKKYRQGLREEMVAMRHANLLRLAFLAAQIYISLFAGHHVLTALAIVFLLLPFSLYVIAISAGNESLLRVAVYMVVFILDWLSLDIAPGLFYFNAIANAKCAILVISFVVFTVQDLMKAAFVRKLLAQRPVDENAYGSEMLNNNKNKDTLALRLLFASFVVALFCMACFQDLYKPSRHFLDIY